MTPLVFISAVSPAAKTSMESTHIPASFVVADAALESGWGNSLLTTEAMNLFGVKADSSWHGPVFNINTREFLDGRWCMELAGFRKYTDWLGSINDHAAFLIDNERYSAAFACTDGPSFATAVANAGYATDPDYAQKIIEIINAHNLAALDSVVVQTAVPKTPITPYVVVTPAVLRSSGPLPVKAPDPTPPQPVTPANTSGFWGWVKKFF